MALDYLLIWTFSGNAPAHPPPPPTTLAKLPLRVLRGRNETHG